MPTHARVWKTRGIFTSAAVPLVCNYAFTVTVTTSSERRNERSPREDDAFESRLREREVEEQKEKCFNRNRSNFAVIKREREERMTEI